MKRLSWDDALVAEHRAYLQDEASQAAFDTLINAAVALPVYEIEGAWHGRIREFRYFDTASGDQPFAFIVNRTDLLFYIRLNGLKRVVGEFESLSRHFDTAKVNPLGEWTVRIASIQDAKRLNSFLFSESFVVNRAIGSSAKQPRRSFTHYWKNSTWAKQAESADALQHAGSSAFRESGVTVGDRVFVVTVIGGALYLGGAIAVNEVTDHDVAVERFGDRIWDAPEHIIARHAQRFIPDLRVPTDIVEALRFEGDKALVFSSAGVLDQQTLRGVRALTEQSAVELQEFMDDATALRASSDPLPEGFVAPALGRLFGEETLMELAVLQRTDIPETTKQAIILARRGQGLFKERVAMSEPRCRVTGVDVLAHLRASHIKPWKVCSDEDRLSEDNGLLLAPHVDHLFDRGYISFSDFGDLLVSKDCPAGVLGAWGISPDLNVGPFRVGQRPYLAYHREHCYKAA